MERLLNLATVGLVLLAMSAHASTQGKIMVVSSTADMADFARQIGGNKVETYAIYNGKYDIHFFEPKPSQVVKLRQADVLIVAGLDGDPWMRSLIDAARNPNIRFGKPGYVDPAIGVAPIQVPTGRIDGAMGDVHPYGNPHFSLTQENARIALENIFEGLCRVSPENREFFTQRKEQYLDKMRRTFEELRDAMSPFEGTKVIEYHQSWDYFCSEFGLEIVATLEPKPGIPPSAAHLSQVVDTVRSSGAQLMFAEPYYPERPIRFVVKQTGVKVLRLPLHVGDKPEITSYLENLRYNVNTIVNALRELRG